MICTNGVILSDQYLWTKSFQYLIYQWQTSFFFKTQPRPYFIELNQIRSINLLVCIKKRFQISSVSLCNFWSYPSNQKLFYKSWKGRSKQELEMHWMGWRGTTFICLLAESYVTFSVFSHLQNKKKRLKNVGNLTNIN